MGLGVERFGCLLLKLTPCTDLGCKTSTERLGDPNQELQQGPSWVSTANPCATRGQPGIHPMQQKRTVQIGRLCRGGGGSEKSGIKSGGGRGHPRPPVPKLRMVAPSLGPIMVLSQPYGSPEPGSKPLIFTSKWTTVRHHGVRDVSLNTHLQSFDSPIGVEEDRPSLEVPT